MAFPIRITKSIAVVKEIHRGCQMLRYSVLLFTVLLALAPAVPAHALAFDTTYTFTGSPGNQLSEPVDANPVGAVFSDITRGSGVTAEAGLNSINSTGWTTSAALDANDYYQFVITPQSGFDVDINTIAVTYRRSATGPLNFQLRSSLGNFVSNLASESLLDDTANHRVGYTGFEGIGYANLTSP
jgi:hypothetical protein